MAQVCSYIIAISLLLQVNHLAPLLLTLELLPLLTQTADSSGDGRVVFVTSKTSFWAPPFNIDKVVVKEEAEYERLATYFSTKLYNVSSMHAYAAVEFC